MYFHVINKTHGPLQINPLSTDPTKWSDTLKQFLDNFPTNCLSVFDYFVGLALKGLSKLPKEITFREKYILQLNFS